MKMNEMKVLLAEGKGNEVLKRILDEEDGEAKPEEASSEDEKKALAKNPEVTKAEEDGATDGEAPAVATPEAEKADEDTEETAKEVDELLDDEDDDPEIIDDVKSLTEETPQIAAGPELKAGKELDNEATLEKKPTEAEPSIDNKDIYPAEEHKQAEAGTEVEIKEESQTAAGPELEAGKELGNEATLEKKPEEASAELDNKDVYPAEEHKQAEAGTEIEIKEQSSAFKRAAGFSNKSKELEAEDEKNGTNKAGKFEKEERDNYISGKGTAAKMAAVKSGKLRSEADKDAEKAMAKADARLAKAEDAYMTEETSQTAAGPELEAGKELDNEATKEKEPSVSRVDITNKDSYPECEHKQTEAGTEVEIKEMQSLFDLLNALNESAQEAAGPELKPDKELDNEATLEKKPEEASAELDNKDVYPAEEHKQAETGTEVEIKEESQTAAGPELEAGKELDNEATKEKEPSVSRVDITNKDSYPECEHKQTEAGNEITVAEMVKVVTEAASRCKKKGKKATKAALCEEAASILKASDPEKEQYDVDASIESAQMNGNKEKFDCYTKTQGEGAAAAKPAESVEPKDLTGLSGKPEVKPEDIVTETAKYSSLREACMLDEGYFTKSTYTIQTADEKKAKLTEQVSMLLAREQMDPMYDELLRTSLYAKRLQESLVSKYEKLAESRVNKIISESSENKSGK